MTHKPLALFLTVALLALGYYVSAAPTEKMSRRSSQWPRVRAEHLNTHPECAACSQTDALNVHHIVPFSFDPALELCPTNLITLCTDGVGHTPCHLLFGHSGNYRCYNPNVVEDAKHFRNMLKNRVCDTIKP